MAPSARSPSQAKSARVPNGWPSVPKPRWPQVSVLVQPSDVMPATKSKEWPTSTETWASSMPESVMWGSRVPEVSLASLPE